MYRKDGVQWAFVLGVPTVGAWTQQLTTSCGCGCSKYGSTTEPNPTCKHYMCNVLHSWIFWLCLMLMVSVNYHKWAVKRLSTYSPPFFDTSCMLNARLKVELKFITRTACFLFLLLERLYTSWNTCRIKVFNKYCNKNWDLLVHKSVVGSQWVF